jgi:hypothetical protein
MSGFKPKFIIFSLCDNDFGDALEFAAKQIWETFSGEEIFCSPERIKEATIKMMLAKINLTCAYRGFSSDDSRMENYLTKQMEVYFNSEKPSVDHDFGSVCIDYSTGYIWRY